MNKDINIITKTTILDKHKHKIYYKYYKYKLKGAFLGIKLFKKLLNDLYHQNFSESFTSRIHQNYMRSTICTIKLIELFRIEQHLILFSLEMPFAVIKCCLKN